MLRFGLDLPRPGAGCTCSSGGQLLSGATNMSEVSKPYGSRTLSAVGVGRSGKNRKELTLLHFVRCRPLGTEFRVWGCGLKLPEAQVFKV